MRAYIYISTASLSFYMENIGPKRSSRQLDFWSPPPHNPRRSRLACLRDNIEDEKQKKNSSGKSEARLSYCSNPSSSVAINDGALSSPPALPPVLSHLISAIDPFFITRARRLRYNLYRLRARSKSPAPYTIYRQVIYEMRDHYWTLCVCIVS